MDMDPWSVFSSNFGMMPMPCAAFVTLVDMALYFAVTANVSRARGKHKVQAPSNDGPPEFMRVLRVQQNTTEQLVLHLPLLWIAALAMNDVFAASFGVIWTVGRILYARGYYRKPKRRAKGFIVSTVVNAILFVAALTGVIASF